MSTRDIHTVAGILNLYKPSGPSTAKYVYRLRPIFGIRKVGHAGTLDPFADGVVIACLGRATKMAERLMSLPKTYRTTLHLGVTNETFDREQPFEPIPDAPRPTREAVEEALAGFVGEVDQVPPAYSAVKVHGVPSYRLARQGSGAAPIVHKSKRVYIERLRVLDFNWPRLQLEVRCGRGTYIRALARDLGRALGSGACCETLTRTDSGPFSSRAGTNLERAQPAEIRSALIEMQEAERLLDGWHDPAFEAR